MVRFNGRWTKVLGNTFFAQAHRCLPFCAKELKKFGIQQPSYHISIVFKLAARITNYALSFFFLSAVQFQVATQAKQQEETSLSVLRLVRPLTIEST